MQTQDAPAEFLFKLWPWLEANKNRLIAAAAAILVLWGVYYFITAQKAQREVDAGQALTMLMVSSAANGNSSQMADSLTQLAAKYSGTAAAQRAQLQAATAQFDAGRYPEAQTQFQKFLEANSTGPLAATAALGVAASLEAQNKMDQAVPAYQRVLSVFSGSASVQPAEFALGRIAEQQNKLTDAASHYENAARAAAGGSLAQEAAMRAAEIKSKIAATAPKPVSAPKPALTPPPTAAPATTAKP